MVPFTFGDPGVEMCKQCDAKLGIQLKMRNIASFGAKIFELRIKMLPDKFIFFDKFLAFII